MSITSPLLPIQVTGVHADINRASEKSSAQAGADWRWVFPKSQLDRNSEGK